MTPSFGDPTPPPEPEPFNRAEWVLLRILQELEKINHGAIKTTEYPE